MQQSVNELAPGARRRGLYAVLAVTFLMNAGFFLIIPLVSVHYVDKLGWAAAFIYAACLVGMVFVLAPVLARQRT